MAHDAAELGRLLDFALSIARDAGAITDRYFGGSFVVDRKADDSFVTQADREAERLIRRAIEEAFPDDSILGEEEGTRTGSSNRRWIIDPIDGTYSFVHGVPLYGVLIGLEIEAEPALGVVNLPSLGELVYAARGLGCFRNGAPARVSDCAALLPILEEAGGTFTDWNGVPSIHGGNAISTNGLLFERVMETIRNAPEE